MGTNWHRMTMPRLLPTQETTFDYEVEQSHCGCGVSQLNSHRMYTRTNFTKKAAANSFTPLRVVIHFQQLLLQQLFLSHLLSTTGHSPFHSFPLCCLLAFCYSFAYLTQNWTKCPAAVVCLILQDCTAYSETWAALSDTFTVTNTGFVFLSFHTCLPTTSSSMTWERNKLMFDFWLNHILFLVVTWQQSLVLCRLFAWVPKSAGRISGSRFERLHKHIYLCGLYFGRGEK